MNTMTVQHVSPLCEALFGSDAKESELDVDLQQTVNRLRTAAAKYSNMSLVEFVGDHHSHVFIKRMWRAAYVINAFGRAERYGVPTSPISDYPKMRAEVLVSRSCKIDAHYFALPEVSQAYAERMEDDMLRRWKHRLDLRVRAYLAYHVAYALYQWNAVVGGDEKERQGLLDMVESYFDLILPDSDYTDARDPEIRSVWQDAKYLKRSVNTEKEWAERVKELAKKEERLLWHVSSSDSSRRTLDDLLDERLAYLSSLLEDRLRDRTPLAADDRRILDCGSYLYPDGVARSDDRYADIRRELSQIDGCKFGNRIRVDARNCMEGDRRRPVMRLEFEFVKKSGLKGCLKKGVAEITKVSVMSDFILLLKTMDRGRNALAEMPRNWTTKYQGAGDGRGRDGRTWRLCFRRYYLEEGMRALFVSYDALLPEEDKRFVNPDVCKLHDRVFRFGFGVKVRRMVPFVKRNVYRNNCGVLYPLDDFHELQKAKVGDVCAAALHIEGAEELQRQEAAPQPKRKAVFQPKASKPVKDDFLAKLRLHRKRYGW